MKNLFIFLLALIMIILLGYYCIYVKNTPLIIQKDINTRAQIALNNTNMPWAKVSVDGRDIKLTGVAPNKSAIEAAEQVARVNGYNVIDNQLTLALSVIDSAPKAEYELLITKLEDQKITLKGTLDKTSHQSLLSSIQQQYAKENISDQIQVSDVVSPNFINQSFAPITQQLKQFKTATAKFNQNNLQLEGVMLAGVKTEDLEQEINQQLPDAINASFKFVEAAPSQIPELPITTPNSSEELAKSCQADFNRVLSTAIHFESASTNIKQSSYTILDDVVSIAKKCEDFNLLVHGHTDSTGDVNFNKTLSLGRANSIEKYLVRKNIENKRLTALGHGSSVPIASNSTASGRAKNRRIEITIKDKQ
ncbi:MAG TPA: BON domain-containing protein [Leucothrix mucor]|nr:BON domain-containing protein [Leucothrix mucor]